MTLDPDFSFPPKPMPLILDRNLQDWFHKPMRLEGVLKIKRACCCARDTAHSPQLKVARIVLFLLALGLGGCVTTEFTLGERNVSVVSGTAGSERPDYQKIESTLTGVTSIFTSHHWENYPQSLAYHLTGGRIYHINFAFGQFGCSAEMDRKFAAFRFFEWESSPRSGIFPSTDEQRAQVRALARDIEAYLRSVLPTSYEIRLSES